MAIPSVYTEATLSAFLHFELGGVAGALGWTVAAGSYAEIVNDTLHDYGEPVIANITGETAVWKLRQLGLYRAWEAAVDGLTAKYDYSTNNQSFKLSQLYDHAKDRLARSEQAIAVYGQGPWAIKQTRIVRLQEPYGPLAIADPTLQVLP